MLRSCALKRLRSKPNVVVVRRRCGYYCSILLPLLSVLAARPKPAVAFFTNAAVANTPSSDRPRRRSPTAFSRASTTMSASASASGVGAVPPVARRDESRVVYAGDVATGPIRRARGSAEALLSPAMAVADPYGWLRDEDRASEEVLSHLRRENEHTERVTSHLEKLRAALYDEMVGRLRETDHTVPVRISNNDDDHDYLYYSRTFEGESYSVKCRAPAPKTNDQYVWDGTKDAPVLPGEERYLDVNELAKDRSYCELGSAEISPSYDKLAYGLDVVGDEKYHLFVKDLGTGNTVRLDDVGDDDDDELEIATLAWGRTDDTIFYTTMDDTQREYRVYKKNLADPTQPDELLYEEDDNVFGVSVYKSQDEKYLFVSTESAETSEVRYLSLEDDDDVTLKLVAKRRPKVLYDVEHREGLFWISTNVGGTPNKKLVTCPVAENCEDSWKEVVLASTSEKLFDGGHARSLDGVTPFRNFLVASGREGGVPRLYVIRMTKDGDGGDEVVESFVPLTFSEDAYDVAEGPNCVYDADEFLVTYDSLVAPPSTMSVSAIDPTNRAVLKTKVVPGYDPSLYACERLFVTARDGTTRIPVDMVYRKDAINDDDARPVPTHLYGYGSYGICVEADWRSTRLPLLDRGVVYVIAHVRGGAEMGRQWYEEPRGAKYLCKKNSFTDFVDVAKWLVEDRRITTPEMLSCEGRSAGGLLIGASINLAPEMFKCAVLGVPFVDVMCTMVDSTIPLTTEEWEEWGNPNEAKYHEYIASYSPMENVRKGARYPSCLLTGGLHDPRVAYWEPAKFAATLREHQSPDSGPVCLKMDMTAGHFSASDRYKYLKELAFDYAFLLDQLGLADVETK